MDLHAPVRLNWAGKDATRPSASGHLRVVQRGDDNARLIQGDNLTVLDTLYGSSSGQVTLAYLDPPFLTGRQHVCVKRSKDSESGKITRERRPGFDDRWNGLGDYLSALRDRVAATRELLTPDGCLVLHVDPKTSHYAKVVCDEIFGPRCFASEIVWRYRRWPSKTPNFQRVHDVLLRYVRDPSVKPKFRQLYEPLAPSTLATWGKTKQRAVVGKDGRRQRSSRTAEPTPGTPMGDVWEISIVAPVSKERTGYPTQKPEALIRRVVEACTDPGDVILDPYLGSGTTIAAATKLGRSAIGIDQNAEAIAIARQRIEALGTKPRVERFVKRRNPAKSGPRSSKLAEAS